MVQWKAVRAGTFLERGFRQWPGRSEHESKLLFAVLDGFIIVLIPPILIAGAARTYSLSNPSDCSVLEVTGQREIEMDLSHNACSLEAKGK